MNRAALGLEGPEKSLVEFRARCGERGCLEGVTTLQDFTPSPSPMEFNEKGNSWIMVVPGLGLMVFHGEAKTGQLRLAVVEER